MTEYLALPPAESIGGSLRVPPSKSATNRALLLAALTEAEVEIVGPLASDDTAALRRNLVTMGASILATTQGIRVSGPLRGEPGREVTLDALDSGTAARFLAAAAAVTSGRFLLTGSPRLRERPMGELVAALTSAGARIVYRGSEGRLPISIEGGRVRSGLVTVNASRSSQFLSALLLAGVAVEGGLVVRSAGDVVSVPYVRMTLETLREFGHGVEEAKAIHVTRGRKIAGRFEIPGDYSSAVPLLATVGMAGGTVALTGLRWPSADADAGAVVVLEKMGIRIAASPSRLDASASAGSLRPIQVRATDFPDSVPTLAALAAMAPGESQFSGVAHLRLKESDRLAALTALLRATGGHADADDDTLTVTGPTRLRVGGVVRLPTFEDHRLAMAAALLALVLPRLLIEGPDCVSKSYPDFFRDLNTLVRRSPAARHHSSRQ